MAIQAVHAEMLRLEKEQETLNDSAVADIDELLLAYSLASEDLKKAYLAVYDPRSNMVPYERLVAKHK